jgi:hypothetical protein|tara:strand:+ start:1933 stop:2898 length:966 start_codon:yes stop_codon:yes gene_type:complete
MINSVRNTVLSVLNKNNYGYISPSDFNLFAKQAQLDVFEDYFYSYNYYINKENARQSGTENADISKSYAEVIESFSNTFGLIPGVYGYVSNFMSLPQNYYLINKINYYPTKVSDGTVTTVTANRLIDAAATFSTDGVVAGNIVVNNDTGAVAYVIAVVSETELVITVDVFKTITEAYSVSSTVGIREVEKVSQNKIFLLNSSNLTAPNTTYPAYVIGGATDDAIGNTATIYPQTITQPGSVIAEYIRYPKDPKWTYADVPTASGEPLYDPTQVDFQDFELPSTDEPSIVNKILEYAGLSIRELEVIKVASSMETRENASEK